MLPLGSVRMKAERKTALRRREKPEGNFQKKFSGILPGFRLLPFTNQRH
jgi:hypothetical protein